MKLIPLAAALILLPVPAMAQSLHETHEPVWHPNGKVPALTYRMRDQPRCSDTSGHHQAGKSALPARSRCVADDRQANAVRPAANAAVEAHSGGQAGS